jgi:hypothetical protein
MPELNGDLTADETNKALAWLQANWGQWRCPASGHRTWVLTPTVVQLEPFTTPVYFSQPLPNRRVFPMLIVSCSVCGYSVLVNAFLTGALQQ